MAAYLPPTENLPIFDPIVFQSEDDALTYAQAIKLFLRYPFAQGTENLQDINVAGTAIFSGKVGQTIGGTGNIQYGDTTSLALRTSGNYNTCIGTHTGDAISTANNNTIVGSYAGDSCNGSDNTLIGKSGGHQLSSGIQNTVLGSEALFTGVSTNNSVAIGYQAGYSTTANGCVAVGSNAGTTQGTGSVALGNLAGVSQNSSCIAIGQLSGNLSQGTFSIAIGNEAGKTSQATSSVAIGASSGRTSQATENVALGYFSGYDTQATKSVAVGCYAGQTTQGANSVAVGHSAGSGSQGANSIAIGFEAGKTSLSTNSIAIGEKAMSVAGGGTPNNIIAIGKNAGNNQIANNNIYIGQDAGNSGSISGGTAAIGIGRNSGRTSQNAAAIAIGDGAGNSGQGQNAIAIGLDTGKTSQGTNAIAIGSNAGLTTQSTLSIAIGASAGTTTQGDNSVAIGDTSGQTTQGANCVAIGSGAGTTTQASGSVCIGRLAGTTNQGGFAVAIGNVAGNDNQAAGCVAIGVQAGQTSQQFRAIAIGRLAGKSSQGTNAIAIGSNAGEASQGARSICIGEGVGSTNMGANNVCISSNSVNTTFTNVLFLNASGIGTGISGSDRTYVMPLRNVAGSSLVQYDNTTKELTFSNAITAPITLSQVGGGVANPVLTIETTDPDTLGAFIKIDKTSASPATNDTIGGMTFTSQIAGVETQFGEISYRHSNSNSGLADMSITNLCSVGGLREILGCQGDGNSTRISSGLENIFMGPSTMRMFLTGVPASGTGSVISSSTSGRLDATRIAFANASGYKYRIRTNGDPNNDAYNVIDAGVITTDALNYVSIGNTTTPATMTTNGDNYTLGTGNYYAGGSGSAIYAAGNNSIIGLPLTNAPVTYNVRWASFDPTYNNLTTQSIASGDLLGCAMYLPRGTVISRVSMYQFASGAGNASAFIYDVNGILISSGLSTAIPVTANSLFTRSFTTTVTIATSGLYFAGLRFSVNAANIGCMTNRFDRYQTASANVFDMRAMTITSGIVNPLVGTATNSNIIPFMNIS